MLTLDMNRLSQGEPERIVTDRCSRFGSATVIRLLPPAQRREYGIAAVKMGCLEEARNIARNFGDAQLGSIVLIRLMPRADGRQDQCSDPVRSQTAARGPSARGNAARRKAGDDSAVMPARVAQAG